MACRLIVPSLCLSKCWLQIVGVHPHTVSLNKHKICWQILATWNWFLSLKDFYSSAGGQWVWAGSNNSRHSLLQMKSVVNIYSDSVDTHYLRRISCEFIARTHGNIPHWTFMIDQMIYLLTICYLCCTCLTYLQCWHWLLSWWIHICYVKGVQRKYSPFVFILLLISVNMHTMLNVWNRIEKKWRQLVYGIVPHVYSLYLCLTIWMRIMIFFLLSGKIC